MNVSNMNKISIISRSSLVVFSIISKNSSIVDSILLDERLNINDERSMLKVDWFKSCGLSIESKLDIF